MNPLGVHALVWVEGWCELECKRAISLTSETGFDLIEIPLLEPREVDAAMTRRLLERHGLSASCSLGLGFDTATEVGLLVLAGGAAAFALPWYAILTLPILFAAGMSLLDTIDGCFMNFAYGWAFSKPVRKIYYNITITGLSVAVALIIGSVELISILTDKAGIESGPAGELRAPPHVCPLRAGQAARLDLLSGTRPDVRQLCLDARDARGAIDGSRPSGLAGGGRC